MLDNGCRRVQWIIRRIPVRRKPALRRFWLAVALTIATTVIAYGTRLSPLWLFAFGWLLGLAGLI
jgi:hypothetical protein